MSAGVTLMLLLVQLVLAAIAIRAQLLQQAPVNVRQAPVNAAAATATATHPTSKAAPAAPPATLPTLLPGLVAVTVSGGTAVAQWVVGISWVLLMVRACSQPQKWQ
jgi:hypothetical protein